MKKLLLVLLVVALAAFLLVGCIPVTPSEGEGEGEGETAVTVAIEDAFVDIDGKTYVSEGDHTIIVTFPAAVAGVVTANITGCGGDYSKAVLPDAAVVLFPDATKKIWTGSGTFAASSSECCASYVEVTSGECADVVCIAFPVIVDGCPPYALIDISVDNCDCLGCAITFASTSTDPDCAESELCCGDDCSGLASWAINVYDYYPFNECCDPTLCEEPIHTCSGVECPIECTTECLDHGTYYAVASLVDNVGWETTYYAKLIVGGGDPITDTCTIVVVEGFAAAAPICVTWTETGDLIGTCTPICHAAANNS